MDIAACVVLYQPDSETPKRILSYSKYVSRIYILDNTEDNQQSFLMLADLVKSDSFTYIHDGENKGISVRLNMAAEAALNAGFNWLLTMDQDSVFDEGEVLNYLNCLSSFSQKDVTAMFGVQFLDKPLQNQICAAEEVAHLITSGSIINLKLFKEIGGFDEALFIDKVDHEYCLRASLFNYKIVRFNNIFLQHNLGNITFGRSLISLKLTPRVIHSPIRMYYITRNYLYLRDKYKGQFKESFDEMKKELWNRIKNNFLYGKHKRLLLSYVIKGYLDYKRHKLGKLR